jgi:hypothetical protein
MHVGVWMCACVRVCMHVCMYVCVGGGGGELSSDTGHPVWTDVPSKCDFKHREHSELRQHSHGSRGCGCVSGCKNNRCG